MMNLHSKNFTLAVICLVLTLGIISAAPASHYRAEIIINGSMVQGNYSDFNMLLTETNMPLNFWENVNTGCDMVFTSDINGSNPLNFELVNFDNSTNKTEIWLNTNLEDVTNKTIYLWYGNLSSVCYSSNVWNSNYRGVWHLNEQGNGTDDEFIDSSNYSNDGFGAGGNRVPKIISSNIGFGQIFDNDAILVQPNSSLNTFNQSFVINMWLKRTEPINLKEDEVVLYRLGNLGSGKGFMVKFVNKTNTLEFLWNDESPLTKYASKLKSNASLFEDGNWHKLTLSVNTTSKEISMFLDGNKTANTFFSKNCGSNLDWYLSIGRATVIAGTGSYYKGSMDEMQFIIGESFDDKKVATEFANQNTPELFATNGTIVDLFEAPNITGASPVNNTSYIGSTLVNFIANITDDFGLKNATLYVYNDSNNLLIEEYNESYSGTMLEEFARNITLGVGTYTWKIVAYDVFDNEYASETMILKINAVSAPVVVASSGGSGGGGGVPYCITSWECSDWSVCVDGTQTRTCSYPANYCEPTIEKPTESQTCTSVETNVEGSNETAGGTEPVEEGAVIGFAKSGSGLLSLIFILLVTGSFIGMNVYNRRKAAVGAKKKSKKK